jgi:Asp-tRNA(Asn)/Glu-tRNA(Gln) amidotransferase A subunit family amidase
LREVYSILNNLRDKVKRMMDRRIFLERCVAAGLGSTLVPGALAAIAVQSVAAQASSDGGKAEAPAITAFPPITVEMLDAAAAIAGITLTVEQRTMMLEGVREQRGGLQAIRDLHIPNSIAPAMVFRPIPVDYKMPRTSNVPPPAKQYAVPMIEGEEKLAFASIPELGALLRSRKMSCVEITRFFLSRTHALDAKLHLLVTPTTERAFAQAAQVDKDIAAGKYRGGLHGIPWGAKDLLSVKGYRTTWGAAGMETQQFDEDATVVQRLDAAGAILISKLTLGALAQGDVWFGGKTRNPWNIKQGSSGSSAGPASAVSAGCCAFAIGSETLGSISSPSTRCGVTGLRPTFGFVPRTGAMALSWSMDKLGPIARSVEDAALVMAAIHGSDGIDTSCIPAGFDRSATDFASLRIGYLESAFAEPVLRTPDANAEKPETEAQRRESAMQRQQTFERQRYDSRYDRATLDALRGMGIQLIPVRLPDLPFSSISKVLGVEAAAAFDEITRNGRVNLLTAQSANDWPNQFRTARMYSGVDYVQAMRARTVLIAQMAELFRTVDIIVAPSGGPQLTATNLSGHPAVIVPNGLRGKDAPMPQDTSDGGRMNMGGPGTPVSITFLGKLYDDATLLAFAQRYQEKTGFHKLHPVI